MMLAARGAIRSSGAGLPYDAEVEYLESTGTQWIDTGVNADSNLSVEITMANAGTPWANVNPMGVILATPRRRHHMSFTSSINYYFGNGDTCYIATGYKPADGEIFTFKVDAASKTFTLGSYLGTFPNDTFDTGLSYWLFGRNGTTPPYLGLLRIYSAKLWNGNTLVRDFIPVRKGTVGYLYDRVSGKLFGNAGTGDFVLGPDVVPVEYIESHGTEYINTGVVPTSSTKWDTDAQFTSSDYGQIMGRAGAPALNPRFAFGLDIQSSGHGLTWYCGMGDVNTWNGTFDTFRHAFSLDAPHKTFTIDTTSYGVPFSSIGDTTVMQLFARFVNGSVQNFCKAKIFKSSIIDNGLPVRSFRPVRVGTDATSWEGAMMDVLTRRIYRNAGTGAFTYGNDLKYPIPA